MRFIINIISIVLVFACLQTNAQDLIKDTRKGVEDISIETPNRLSQMIEAKKNEGAFNSLSPFTISKKELLEQHKSYVNDAAYLELSKANLEALYNGRSSNIVLEIPVAEGRSFELELTRVEVTTDDYAIKINGGKSQSYKAFPGLFYRGIIKDKPGSLAAISIYEDHVRGLIANKKGNYVLGKLQQEENTYILYNDWELKVSSNFSCGVKDEDLPMPNSHDDIIVNTEKTAGDCVEIYVDADNAMYVAQGSSQTNVNNFVTALMNEVATLYTNENISVVLGTTNIWTSADPYVGLTNTLDVLEAFRDNNPTFPGDLAHFISTRNIGGGIAWLNQLCGSLPYAVSASMNTTVIPLPAYSWDVMVFAHEMGHNFGSRHTQWCGWTGGPIDNCVTQEDDNSNSCASCCSPGPTPTNGGTIMSYCHLVNSIGINLALGFGAQPGTLIENNYNNATCFNPCSNPCPTNLVITTTYPTGTTIDLEADNNITASNLIQGGGTVDYDAGNSITLQAGFSVSGVFNAFIDGCGGSQLTADNTPPSDVNPVKTTMYEIEQTGLHVRPNPFSRTTLIEIDLAEDTEVSIQIFNLNGQVVSQLLNGESKTKGKHQINFNAGNLPAGMYYCILKAGAETRTQKLAISQ